jgi:CO/xanthine dehydrogenase FAD-binding subunit
MKPAEFEYAAPHTLAEALDLVGETARPLAGGQSLVPLLNFRLARPELLVDLNGVGELSYLRRSEGVLRIGALARQATLERSGIVARGWRLLRDAVRYVGHSQIRSRGTVGGSVAHADPAAELPTAFTALDARFHLESRRGRRTLDSGELFRGPLTTALAPDELLVEIEVPPLPAGAAAAFTEHSRTHGDFAIAGAAVVLVPGERAAVALLGAGPTPVRAPAAEAAIAGGAEAAEAAELAASGIGEGWSRALFAALVRRAIAEALARSENG